MAEGVGLKSNTLASQAIDIVEVGFKKNSNPVGESKRFVEIVGTPDPSLVRLLHRAHAMKIKGRSYRLRDREASPKN